MPGWPRMRRPNSLALSVFLPDRAYGRKLLRPWKLASFCVGMAWLLYGALNYQIGDWDVGISLVMGGLTYLCAPWTVMVLARCLRERPSHWPWGITLALLVAWAVIDGSYVAYNTLLGHPMLRYENFCASSALYFLAGVGWWYRGSLADLWGNIRQLRLA